MTGFAPRDPPPGYLRIADAALAIGVSVDTVRRWAKIGKIQTVRNESNYQFVSPEDVQRLRRPNPRGQSSGSEAPAAHMRVEGVVRSIKEDGASRVVEIAAGPIRVTANATAEMVDYLGLKPGCDAVAVLKSTTVLITRADGE